MSLTLAFGLFLFFLQTRGLFLVWVFDLVLVRGRVFVNGWLIYRSPTVILDVIVDREFFIVGIIIRFC